MCNYITSSLIYYLVKCLFTQYNCFLLNEYLIIILYKMKGLKTLDFFQKMALDNVTQPTILGSLLSLSAIALIFFLLTTEVMNYFTPTIKKDTIVYHDPDQKSRINVNMGILIPNVPCYILSVDQEDSIGNHRMDIRDTLTKMKMNLKDIKDSMVTTTQHSPEVVIKAISDNEGCYISGHVPISKVPGDIHISFHNYADHFRHIRETRKDIFTKISLNHKMNSITFGDSGLKEKILERFGFNENTAFDRGAKLPNYEKEIIRQNYDYFIKIIPHLFVDNIRGEQYLGYQYSLTSKTREYDVDSNEMPIIKINYDLSPVTMKITLQPKSFAHSLTHICAIVGGVFVIFSMLNRLLLAFCDFKSSEKKGVASKE